MKNMQISKILIDYVADGDLHTTNSNIQYSTDLRETVTVGYMIEHYKKETESLVELKAI
jgi:hypothetical protein